MARPIWTGTLSFGLLNVPIKLMTAERRTDLHFRMLDARNNAPIRYERVNAETGEEVPWKEIVKAFEYDKGNYVVLEQSDFESAAAKSHETVDVETFVDATSINPMFFDKPYILVPGKKAEKGYVLLRETLVRTGKIGIARVVIRTREYLSAVLPHDKALVLMLLRYPQELVDLEEYVLPAGEAADFRITEKELQMAEQLIESMSGEWRPSEYRDEYRERLHRAIEQRMRSQGMVRPVDHEEPQVPANATTNVVDFMALLRKSLESNQRTPAKKAAATTASAPAKKTAKKTKAAKKAVAKKPARPRKSA